jgi:hypothetical protein
MHLAENESCWERGEAQASRTCLITDRFIHHVHFADYIAWYWLKSSAEEFSYMLHTTKNTRILTKRRRCTFKLRTQRMCYWKIYTYSILRVVIPPKNSPRPIHPNQKSRSIVYLRRTPDQIMQTQAPLDASPLFFYVASSLYAESIQAQPVDASMPLHHP